MSDEQTTSEDNLDPVERLPDWIRFFIQGLIVYSIVTMAIATMEGIPDSLRSFLEVSEVVVVVLFSIEFVGLWVMSKDYWRYPLRFSSLMDLAAILPFYLSTGVDLRGIRVLRLLRLARILNAWPVQPSGTDGKGGIQADCTGTRIHGFFGWRGSRHLGNGPVLHRA